MANSPRSGKKGRSGKVPPRLALAGLTGGNPDDRANDECYEIDLLGMSKSDTNSATVDFSGGKVSKEEGMNNHRHPHFNASVETEEFEQPDEGRGGQFGMQDSDASAMTFAGSNAFATASSVRSSTASVRVVDLTGFQSDTSSDTCSEAPGSVRPAPDAPLEPSKEDEGAQKDRSKSEIDESSQPRESRVTPTNRRTARESLMQRHLEHSAAAGDRRTSLWAADEERMQIEASEARLHSESASEEASRLQREISKAEQLNQEAMQLSTEISKLREQESLDKEAEKQWSILLSVERAKSTKLQKERNQMQDRGRELQKKLQDHVHELMEQSNQLKDLKRCRLENVVLETEVSKLKTDVMHERSESGADRAGEELAAENSAELRRLRAEHSQITGLEQQMRKLYKTECEHASGSVERECLMAKLEQQECSRVHSLEVAVRALTDRERTAESEVRALTERQQSVVGVSPRFMKQQLQETQQLREELAQSKLEQANQQSLSEQQVNAFSQLQFETTVAQGLREEYADFKLEAIEDMQELLKELSQVDTWVEEKQRLKLELSESSAHAGMLESQVLQESAVVDELEGQLGRELDHANDLEVKWQHEIVNVGELEAKLVQAVAHGKQLELQLQERDVGRDNELQHLQTTVGDLEAKLVQAAAHAKQLELQLQERDVGRDNELQHLQTTSKTTGDKDHLTKLLAERTQQCTNLQCRLAASKKLWLQTDTQCCMLRYLSLWQSVAATARESRRAQARVSQGEKVVTSLSLAPSEADAVVQEVRGSFCTSGSVPHAASVAGQGSISQDASMRRDSASKEGCRTTLRAMDSERRQGTLSIKYVDSTILSDMVCSAQKASGSIGDREIPWQKHKDGSFSVDPCSPQGLGSHALDFAFDTDPSSSQALDFALDSSQALDFDLDEEIMLHRALDFTLDNVANGRDMPVSAEPPAEILMSLNGSSMSCKVEECKNGQSVSEGLLSDSELLVQLGQNLDSLQCSLRSRGSGAQTSGIWFESGPPPPGIRSAVMSPANGLPERPDNLNPGPRRRGEEVDNLSSESPQPSRSNSTITVSMQKKSDSQKLKTTQQPHSEKLIRHSPKNRSERSASQPNMWQSHASATEQSHPSTRKISRTSRQEGQVAKNERDSQKALERIWQKDEFSNSVLGRQLPAPPTSVPPQRDTDCYSSSSPYLDVLVGEDLLACGGTFGARRATAPDKASQGQTAEATEPLPGRSQANSHLQRARLITLPAPPETLPTRTWQCEENLEFTPAEEILGRRIGSPASPRPRWDATCSLASNALPCAPSVPFALADHGHSLPDVTHTRFQGNGAAWAHYCDPQEQLLIEMDQELQTAACIARSRPSRQAAVRRASPSRKAGVLSKFSEMLGDSSEEESKQQVRGHQSLGSEGAKQPSAGALGTRAFLPEPHSSSQSCDQQGTMLMQIDQDLQRTARMARSRPSRQAALRRAYRHGQGRASAGKSHRETADECVS